MKLSTKGRYGLRAMLDLAIHSKEEHVSLKSIASRQGISENYLEQVFSTIRKSGLVRSVKGAQGGYILSEPPSNIMVGTILRVLEGDLSFVDESADNKSEFAMSIQNCIKINLWDKLNGVINQLLDSFSLEDLVNEYEKMNSDNTIMYYI